MVGLSGLEPLTLRLSGVCSNHLSYKPIKGARDICYGTVNELYPQAQAGSTQTLAGLFRSRPRYPMMGNAIAATREAL